MGKTNLIKLILAIGALAAIAVIIIVAGRVPPAKEIIKLKIGMMPIADCLSLFVAQEKGFFSEEGLEVEPIPMAGGAVIIPAVEKGELDIGWSNVVSNIIAYEEGRDYKFLAPGAFKDPKSADLFQLLVSSDSDINEPKDLEGKTVAVNTFKNIMEMALRAWSEKNNVDYNKLKVVAVPFPQMESALETKEIDVAFSIEPYVTLSKTSGVSRVLDERPYDALAERLMIASWFAKKSWIDANPEKAKAFINAINKANKHILEHPLEMPAIVAKNTRLPIELAGQITLPTFSKDIIKKDLQVIMDGSYKYGYIKEKFDVKELVVEGLKLK